MNRDGVVTYTLAALGVYAFLSRVALPIYDLLTRLRLHRKPNWKLLGATTSEGWALITGASTGMGREYALQLSKKGLNVIIISDPATEKELSEVETLITSANPPRKVIKIVADLLDETVYESIIVPAIRDVLPNVSVLINNVGMCVLNRYDRATIEVDYKMFTLNVVPMIRMTKIVLPHMKKAKRGAIVSMASLSGDIPTPFLAVYGATKAFVRAFNGSIREEVRKFPNISVTTPMPFGVKTPLYDKIDQNTVGEERRDQLCVEASVAVEAIIRKMFTNRDHYGPDLHDLIGCAMAFMSKERSSEEFRKALIDSVPRPPGFDPTKDEL